MLTSFINCSIMKMPPKKFKVKKAISGMSSIVVLTLDFLLLQWMS